jgi:drug/metabolite transporter (DMT)-like permease
MNTREETPIRINYIFVGISSAILFSLATPISKLLLMSLNEYFLAGLLYLGGAIGTIPILIYKKEFKNITHLRKSPKEIGKIMTSIIFGGILGPVFLLLGLRSANAGSVSIWLNLELVATALLGRFFFKESLDKNSVIGILFMIGSGVIVTFNEGVAGIIPAVLVFLACVCWGLDNHSTGMIEQISPSQVTFLKGIFASVINISLGIFVNQQFTFNFEIVGSLLLGIFAYGISIVLYIITAQNIGSTRSQILFSSAPIFGIFFSSIILEEAFSVVHIFALAFTIIGIYFSNQTNHKHLHFHTRLSHIHHHNHDDGHHDHKLDEKEGDLSPKIHSHRHSHEEQKHEHKHFPDLHHRHEHE